MTMRNALNGRAAFGAALLLAMAFSAVPVSAQQTHVVIITGLAGEPKYAQEFHDVSLALFNTARDQWKVVDSSLVWLSADPARDATRIRARASRESVADAFLALSRRVTGGDVVLVVLVGHGSGEGAGSRVNLPGPDPTAAEYATWLAAFSAQTVVVFNTATASGDFVDVLRAPGRVVITATRSSFERNESRFAGFFARGIASGEADADKDGRIAVREAFAYADREVARSYQAAGTMQSEHAVLSDTVLAARISFGPPVAGNDDPRVRALLSERRAVEDSVTALRSRRAEMTVDAYEAELERLLVRIAEINAAIRAAGGRP
jgi:hypothetical protein